MLSTAPSLEIPINFKKRNRTFRNITCEEYGEPVELMCQENITCSPGVQWNDSGRLINETRAQALNRSQNVMSVELLCQENITCAVQWNDTNGPINETRAQALNITRRDQNVLVIPCRPHLLLEIFTCVYVNCTHGNREIKSFRVIMEGLPNTTTGINTTTDNTNTTDSTPPASSHFTNEPQPTTNMPCTIETDTATVLTTLFQIFTSNNYTFATARNILLNWWIQVPLLAVIVLIWFKVKYRKGASSVGKPHAICPICYEPVQETTKGKKGSGGIFCNGICKDWLHRRCAGLSKKIIELTSENKKQFYCAHCRLDYQEKDLAVLKEKLAYMYTYRPDINLIFKGIEECSKGTPWSDCRNHNMDEVVSVSSSIYTSIQRRSIRDLRRLGEYDELRARPILVTFFSSRDVSNILDKRKCLSRPHSIEMQLTPKKYLQTKVLKEERWRLMQTGVDRKSIKIRNSSIFIEDQLHGNLDPNNVYQHLPV